MPLALSGLFGALLLAVYFAAPLSDPALVKLFSMDRRQTRRAVVDLGRQYHDLLFLGTWLQATGALLSVVFLASVMSRRIPCTITLQPVLWHDLGQLGGAIEKSDGGGLLRPEPDAVCNP